MNLKLLTKKQADNVLREIRRKGLYTEACKNISTEALEDGVIDDMIMYIKRDSNYHGKDSTARSIINRIKER